MPRKLSGNVKITEQHASEENTFCAGPSSTTRKFTRLPLYTVHALWDKPKTPHGTILTFNVMPSCTNSSSVSSQVPVTLSLISPLSGSTAYTGDLPSRRSHICDKVKQPPRVLPSADSMYSREETAEYRIDTGMLSSHSGLGIGEFGDGVSLAAATSKASRLRPASFPRAVDISVISGIQKRWCPFTCCWVASASCSTFEVCTIKQMSGRKYVSVRERYDTHY